MLFCFSIDTTTLLFFRLLSRTRNGTKRNESERNNKFLFLCGGHNLLFVPRSVGLWRRRRRRRVETLHLCVTVVIVVLSVLCVGFLSVYFSITHAVSLVWLFVLIFSTNLLYLVRQNEGNEARQDSRSPLPLWAKPGPDPNGGWEECKESEPPMGKAALPCKVGGVS